MTSSEFENVKQFMHNFRKHGHAIAIVGGFARDMYMAKGEIPLTRDIDFVTTAPENFLKSNFDAKKIVKEGSLHNTYSIKYYGVSEAFDVTIVDSIDDDLKSRDFTLNSLAYFLDKEGKFIIHDIVNGRKDIDEGRIHCFNDSAYQKIADDPIRILRVCRFAAKYNFKISDNVVYACADSAKFLRFVKKERIWGEFQKSLTDCSRRYTQFIETLESLKVFDVIFPNMEFSVVPRIFYAGNTAIAKIDNKDELLPLALLFVGSDKEYISKTLSSLKFPNAVIKKINDFVFLYGYLNTLGTCESDACIYDIMSKMDSLIIQRMFYPLHNVLSPDNQYNIGRLMFAITKGSVISRHYYSGDVLIEKYGIEPGPKLGEILAKANQLYFDNYEKVGSSFDWLDHTVSTWEK